MSGRASGLLDYTSIPVSYRCIHGHHYRKVQDHISRYQIDVLSNGIPYVSESHKEKVCHRFEGQMLNDVPSADYRSDRWLSMSAKNDFSFRNKSVSRLPVWYHGRMWCLYTQRKLSGCECFKRQNRLHIKSGIRSHHDT
jgi:hypothetical protein